MSYYYVNKSVYSKNVMPYIIRKFEN